MQNTPNQAAPVNPQIEQALSQLHDIKMPEQVSQFPPAYGWWLLALLGLVVIILIVVAVKRYNKKRLQKKLALEHLKAVNPQSDSALEQINTLLKRACLSYFDRELIASLHGQTWQSFLSSHYKKGKEANELDLNWLSTLYAKEQLSESQVTEFKAYATTWIEKSLPPKNQAIKFKGGQ